MKTYLGDSVYVEYVENEAIEGIVLTTENGLVATNTILIEPDVFGALIEFINEIRRKNGAEPIVIPKGNKHGKEDEA